MAARDGMANLITTLRAWAEVGTAEYTIVGSTTEVYFTDNHLQDILDTHRQNHYRLPLMAAPRQGDDGQADYHDYYFEGGYWEEAETGSTAWEVETSAGSAIGTASYTVNYRAGHIYFSADQLGTAYYLTARSFDMHRAAADVWRRKAANVASRTDWSSDNHSVKASQLRNSYFAMASYYENQAPAKMVRLMRGDVN